MSFYSSSNNQTTKQIYNIIDDIEQKLTKGSSSRRKYRGDDGNYSYYNDNINPYYNRSQINSFSNDAYIHPINTNQSQVIPPNLALNQSSEIDIRKIIKEEFSSLILPYQNDLNNNVNILQNKINNMSNDLQNDNIKLRAIQNNNNDDKIKKEVKNMLSEYITFNEFNKKIQELEDLITSNTNNLNQSNIRVQKLDDKFNNKKVKNINKNF